MELKDNKKYIYRIFDKQEGKIEGSYSRACHDVYDFESVSQARNANCHDRYKDEDRFSIVKIEVTEKVIPTDGVSVNEDGSVSYKKYIKEKPEGIGVAMDRHMLKLMMEQE